MEKHSHQNGSQTSLRSQEVLDLQADSSAEAAVSAAAAKSEVITEDEEIVSAPPPSTKLTATYTFPDEDKPAEKTLTNAGNTFRISNGAHDTTTPTETGHVIGAKGLQTSLGDTFTKSGTFYLALEYTFRFFL